MAPRKNMGHGKFWPDLEVWKAFLIGLEVPFSGSRLGVSNYFLSLAVEFLNRGLAFSRSLEFGIPMTPKSIP